ncbi:protein SPT2 homolog isoform X1 [Asparagus officinalis]|nr:protein SPT2 homolog isoform X1 [Asparagus officinalis]
MMLTFLDTKEERATSSKTSISELWILLILEDGRQAQPPASRKPQMAKPARPVPNGHVLKNPATKSLQSQSEVGPVKSSSLIRSKLATAEPKKIANGGSGSGRPVERKPLPSKIPAQSLGTSRHPGTIRPPAKVTSAVHHSSAQRNHYPEQRSPSQSLNNGKPTASKPLPSSKSQPPKKIPPPQDSHDDRLKKKPMKRRLDESDDEDAIGMIRKLFRYDPNKYAAVDDDVSDMEADFREIQKEERRSAKIARKEDEEQLRLIEEEERRERMRKKQKLRR